MYLCPAVHWLEYPDKAHSLRCSLRILRVERSSVCVMSSVAVGVGVSVGVLVGIGVRGGKSCIGVVGDYAKYVYIKRGPIPKTSM